MTWTKPLYKSGSTPDLRDIGFGGATPRAAQNFCGVVSNVYIIVVNILT